jgi:hypothetical protein
MSYVRQNTLVMCLLSSDPTLRAYETDLLCELDQKGRGLLKVIIGEGAPGQVIRSNDAAIECQGLSRIGDEDSTVICVIAGQLLAFFAALARDCARVLLPKMGLSAGPHPQAGLRSLSNTFDNLFISCFTLLFWFKRA